MQSLLTDLTPTSVRAALEENLVTLLAAFGHLPGAAFQARPSVTLVSTSLPSPMFSGVARTRLTAEAADAAIARTLHELAERGVERAFWWTGDLSRPSDLGARLTAHGLQPYEIDAPGMAADLLALPEPTTPPAGLSITPVEDQAALGDWAAAFIAGMGMPPFGGRSWLAATNQLGVGRTPWRLLLGRLDGRPVAVGLLFPSASVAGLYAIATVPEARGRGIGAAMTRALLDEARARGYRVAVLWASAMGLGVYGRLGFQRYGSVSRYLWQRPS